MMSKEEFKLKSNLICNIYFTTNEEYNKRIFRIQPGVYRVRQMHKNLTQHKFVRAYFEEKLRSYLTLKKYMINICNQIYY